MIRTSRKKSAKSATLRLVVASVLVSMSSPVLAIQCINDGWVKKQDNRLFDPYGLNSWLPHRNHSPFNETSNIAWFNSIKKRGFRGPHYVVSHETVLEKMSSKVGVLEIVKEVRDNKKLTEQVKWTIVRDRKNNKQNKIYKNVLIDLPLAGLASSLIAGPLAVLVVSDMAISVGVPHITDIFLRKADRPEISHIDHRTLYHILATEARWVHVLNYWRFDQAKIYLSEMYLYEVKIGDRTKSVVLIERTHPVCVSKLSESKIKEFIAKRK